MFDVLLILTLVTLNKLRFPRPLPIFNQSDYLIQVVGTSSILNDKQCSFRSEDQKWSGSTLFAKAGQVLTLKAPSKICSRQHSKLFLLFCRKKISIDISCESSTEHVKSYFLWKKKSNKKKNNNNNKKKNKTKKKTWQCRLLQILLGALKVKKYWYWKTR